MAQPSPFRSRSGFDGSLRGMVAIGAIITTDGPNDKAMRASAARVRWRRSRGWLDGWDSACGNRASRIATSDTRSSTCATCATRRNPTRRTRSVAWSHRPRKPFPEHSASSAHNNSACRMARSAADSCLSGGYSYFSGLASPPSRCSRPGKGELPKEPRRQCWVVSRPRRGVGADRLHLHSRDVIRIEHG